MFINITDVEILKIEADLRALLERMVVKAESGICAVTRLPDEPVKVGVSMADITTGATAILEALIERGITGKGKAIQISMLDAMADMMCVPLLHYDYMNREAPRMGLTHSVTAPYGKFSCSDGDVVIVCQQHAEWVRFRKGVLQNPDPCGPDCPSGGEQAALGKCVQPA